GLVARDLQGRVTLLKVRAVHEHLSLPHDQVRLDHLPGRAGHTDLVCFAFHAHPGPGDDRDAEDVCDREHEPCAERKGDVRGEMNFTTWCAHAASMPSPARA